MPRTCTICPHRERAAIDQAIIAGEPNTRIASLFAVSEQSVRRHKDNHLPASMVKAAEEVDVRDAIDIVKQLRAINQASLYILREARDTGQLDTALRAIGRIQNQIELQAKLLGELDDRPRVNILISPEWLVVRGVLMVALDPYPEARLAVAGSLARLEADGEHGG